MIEARSFPYGGVPVYNPQSLTKGEAIAQFHARQAAYESLLDLLREERPSHVLIIGTRGMGKTTLLQRVHYGVEEDVALNNRYLVLAFPEEQYNVNRLHHFLLNAVDALADAMERLKNTRMLDRVEGFVEAVNKLSQEEIESRVPKFLAEVSQDLGQSLLMLVDNADRLFDTIEKQEQWRLRELLSSRPDLTLFGATTQASEGIYGTDRAFFEFFKIHRLTPLTLEEVRKLLLQLSESVEEPEGEKGAAKRRVQEWLDADAARLRTLVQLTGGNPRTTVLLFHLVLDGLAGGAREYLEQLLDQCTPGYKGRVDELPPQAQQVLDAVALKWDPVTAMEIGEDTGLETNIVSTQLTRLVRQGILEKADPGDSKKALYQVAERFFNIWYLIRARRRVRAKLRWFVEFLRVFFEAGELERMAWDRLERSRSARTTGAQEIETAFAYILASGAEGDRFEAYLRQSCADSEGTWLPLLDLIHSSAGEIRKGTDASAETPNAASALRRDSSNLSEAEVRRATEIAPDDPQVWENLGAVLLVDGGHGEDAELAYRKAIAIDPKRAEPWAMLGTLLASDPARRDEAREAIGTALQLEPVQRVRSMLKYLLAVLIDRWDDAEVAIRDVVELNPELADPWALLGEALAKLKRRDKAEMAFRKAIELEPKSFYSWFNLGKLLAKTSERSEEAEMAFRKAIDLKPNSAHIWAHLGRLLTQTADRGEQAEVALRKAIEIDPASREAWALLGFRLMGFPDRWDEAETCFRKLVELSPEKAEFWAILGRFLRLKLERSEDAEAAIRTAVRLDPEPGSYLGLLADFLAEIPDRREEAGDAFVKTLEQDPGDGDTWGRYGLFLACRAPAKQAEAENALSKAMELDPDNPETMRNLGVLLCCGEEKKSEGIEYLQQAWRLATKDPVTAGVLTACVTRTVQGELLPILIEASDGVDFWNELINPWGNYAPFGKILLEICNLILGHDKSNQQALLTRAVGLAQMGDFPRASVALEDALYGDPIDLLSSGRMAIEIFLAAAVRHGRVQDCIELLDKKEWKDAWRPIYEALRSVQEGSAEYLKRVAVEIREPTLTILRRIAPELHGLAP
jgi:cytochrome c-type biogenesis protein CcmH/NrfG